MANDDQNQKPPRRFAWAPNSIVVLGIALILAVVFWDPIHNQNRETDLQLTPKGLHLIVKAQTAAAKDQQEKDPKKISPGAEVRAQTNADQVKHSIDKIAGRTILWIDDHPENNIDLQNGFSQGGVRTFIALSNADARALLAIRSFDLAITDVNRDSEGATAGLDMLPALAQRNIPTIVYSASWSWSHLGQEQAYKVAKITNDPTVVYATAISEFKEACSGFLWWRTCKRHPS